MMLYAALFSSHYMLLLQYPTRSYQAPLAYIRRSFVMGAQKGGAAQRYTA
jgi:hypothetical protein